MSAKKTFTESRENVVQLPLSKAEKPRERMKKPSAMTEYTNRKGKTYYLQVGQTKKGNPRYHFSKKTSGEMANMIPEGYEIYENPNAQVFLRKIQPKEIFDEERETMERALRTHADQTKYKIDIKGKMITIFWTDQSGPKVGEFPSFLGMARMEEFYESHAYFSPMIRFTLVDPQERQFIAERYCFRGSIDDWIHLLGGGPDSLETLVKRYVKHLGEESFYELM